MTSLADRILATLHKIAPDVDPAAVNRTRPLVDQLDLDSMDYQAFLAALSTEHAVPIPEQDIPHLRSIADLAAYIESHAPAAPPRGAGQAIIVSAILITALAVPASADAQPDLRPLVEALAQKRCAEGKGYQAIGGVPCTQAGRSGRAEDPDAALSRIGTTAKQQVQALSLQARKEDAACARGIPTAAGGTSVGPSTPEQLASTMVKAAVEDALSLSLPVGMMLSIPGVTQVQYDYKGLRDGPELRTFKISGRVEGEPAQARLHLRLDGDVEGDRNLYLEYTVNYQKSRSPFPAWSPFLDAPGDIRPSAVRQGLTTLSSIATFAQQGSQRNGVKVWHDYDYHWQAERIGFGPDDILKARGSDRFADHPYGGDWVGVGWGAETRFKQTRRAFVAQFSPGLAKAMPPEQGEGVIMSVNVKHQTAFYFHVDRNGNVSGRGNIVYTLDPNLCGVAALTRQVNEQVNLMKMLPAIYLAAHQLGRLAVRRFQQAWSSAPSTITTRMDEVLRGLPRIERAAGEAEIKAFTATNKALPTRREINYAFADIEVESVPVKRMWGLSGDKQYQGLRLRPGERLAPPTPVDAAGNYSGRFQTRPGRPGWFEDGRWFEADPGTPGVPGRGPGWNRKDMGVKNLRANDSELRILEELARTLPKGTKGRIRLYTQRPPCSSCAGVVEQFSALFPDILIVVTSGG
ncbi:MAG TPA: deaminase domain-containing protein [Kofleriaceae bacterium]|nr:deaminase domain-containing protein [Kofleriaceae bacterium]